MSGSQQWPQGPVSWAACCCFRARLLQQPSVQQNKLDMPHPYCV